MRKPQKYAERFTEQTTGKEKEHNGTKGKIFQSVTGNDLRLQCFIKEKAGTRKTMHAERFGKLGNWILENPHLIEKQ